MQVLIFAIILRLFSNPIANVIQKKLTRDYSSFLVNTVTYLGLSIIVLPIIFKTDFLNLPNVIWLYGALGGLLGALGNGALIKALSLGDLSVLGPINAYKPVVSMFFGILLLKEIPSILGILAIGLIILGSYFIFDTVEEKFSFRLFKRKDIQYRMLALICTAAEAIIIKKVILLTSVEISFVFWCCFGFLFSFVFVLFRKEKFHFFKKESLLKFIILILMFGIMQYSTNYVFNNMNTSYALSIFQLSSIITIFLGYKFFHEKDILKKIFAAIIMIIGAVIIILY